MGLIPARGGSKGLPRKNLRPLLGKPLIAWTIEQAKKSRLLDAVIVNTDDEEIAAVSRTYGAEVPFLRPPELASDASPVIDTLLHAFDRLASEGREFDYLALLEPTSPLRKDDDIDNAITQLIENESRAESLVSVGNIALEHPAFAKQISPEGMMQPYLNGDAKLSMRQDLPKSYFPYGVIYLAKIPVIRKTKHPYPEKVLSFPIERWQNYEINDLWDFLCVEAVLKERIR